MVFGTILLSVSPYTGDSGYLPRFRECQYAVAMKQEIGTKKALEPTVTKVRICNSCHIHSLPCPICLPERQIKSGTTEYDRTAAELSELAPATCLLIEVMSKN